MTELPDCVIRSLSDPVYLRGETSEVLAALEQLKVPATSLFGGFYRTYSGRFGSEKFSHELLDLVEHDENIVSFTRVCRQQYGFFEHHLVLTNMSGGSVFVYDVKSDKVFNVDFEAGVRLLQCEQLPPKWLSFREFLVSYFC